MQNGKAHGSIKLQQSGLLAGIENAGTDIVNAFAGIFHKHVNPPPPLVIKEWDFGDQGALLIYTLASITDCHLQLKLHQELLSCPFLEHTNCIVDVLSWVCCFIKHHNPWSGPEPDMY